MRWDGSDIGRGVDSVSRRVVSGGIHYKPDKKIVILHSETPIPTVALSKGERDLTGTKFAKFTVIGKWGSNSKGVCRVVKCVCGRYTVRRTKTVHKPHPDDCCEECRQLLFLKRREEFLKYGRNKDERA